jgi:hypothetical protein
MAQWFVTLSTSGQGPQSSSYNHRPPSNRNGSQAESADRLQQLEARIASTENELQITFRRIDELQVELDRAIQARPLKRTR